jgi:hypothetical protein
MAKTLSSKPSDHGTSSRIAMSDAELLERLRASEWRDDMIDDLGDREEVMERLFDVALQSLKRTNAVAQRAVQESAASRREFDSWLVKMRQSQNETRSMIEDLVSGQ